MGLKQQIQADLAEAMRAGDAGRRDTLRLLLAAIQQVEVDRGQALTESDVTAVIARQAKQRRESIADYERGGRADLAAAEADELAIIEAYMPEMMDEAAIRAAAATLIAELGANGPQDTGRVMARLMPQLKGKADGRLVNQVVRALLD